MTTNILLANIGSILFTAALLFGILMGVFFVLGWFIGILDRLLKGPPTGPDNSDY